MGRKPKPQREPAPKTGGSWTFNPSTGQWHPTGAVVEPAGDIDTPTEDLTDGTDS